jgi:hypothetical protein
MMQLALHSANVPPDAGEGLCQKSERLRRSIVFNGGADLCPNCHHLDAKRLPGVEISPRLAQTIGEIRAKGSS